MFRPAALLLVASWLHAARWDAANPPQPLPEPPLGSAVSLAAASTLPTPATVRLGRWLFYDARLSADGRVSCATCHVPQHGFSELTPVSTGIGGRRGTRKAPPILNLAHPMMTAFFWDGRARSLEEQALEPIVNPLEMGNTLEGMLATLRAIPGYRPYFREAFGTDEVTAPRVGRAIADYERTRMSGNAPWDRYWTGGDLNAVTADAREGAALFNGKARCGDCHSGPNFTDGAFHNIGVGWDREKRRYADEGRFLVTGQPSDRGAFRTPTLREVAGRAPYMHDGSIATLRAVVEFYNRGGNPSPELDGRMRVLNLTEGEIDALVSFMLSLTGEGYLDEPPSAFPQ